MKLGEKERIAERAYQIWEQQGRPHGRDLDHWLQAEQEAAAGGKTSRRGRTAAGKGEKAAGTSPKRASTASSRKTTTTRKSGTKLM